MLILDDSLKINHGKTRDCFAHPTDDSLVVKTAFPGDDEGFISNANELLAYNNLMELHPGLSCVTRCVGYTATNRGEGLLCQSIRDDDGSISKSIWNLIVYQDDCDVPYIRQIITDFCHHLRDNDIFIFDLNLKNIVLQLGNTGVYTPFIIDLKSQIEIKEFIPLSTHIKYFSRKKLHRRTNQLIARIGEFRQRRAELIKRDAKGKI
jgi:hypothetical protein